MSSIVKVVTINILSDLSRWKKRRELLVEGLQAISPNLIALQEVRLPQNPAQWLADELSFPYVHLCPKRGFESKSEAIAILSQFPFECSETLDLGGQGRVAQYVCVNVDNHQLAFSNGHFYWQPGNSSIRLKQIKLLFDWLKRVPHDSFIIVCGDFNSTPETLSIQYMLQHYISAHAATHGQEPEYTCPTPLPRARLAQIRTLLGFFLLIRPKHLNPKWRGTLDYIFVNPRVKVLDCQVVLNEPSRKDPQIYPSDHFGLFATLEMGTL